MLYSNRMLVSNQTKCNDFLVDEKKNVKFCKGLLYYYYIIHYGCAACFVAFIYVIKLSSFTISPLTKPAELGLTLVPLDRFHSANR